MTSLLTSLDEFLRSNAECINRVSIRESDITICLCSNEQCFIEIKLFPGETNEADLAFDKLRAFWEGYRLGSSDLRDSDTPEVDSGGWIRCASPEDCTCSYRGAETNQSSHFYDWKPDPHCPIPGHSTDQDAPEASPDATEYPEGWLQRRLESREPD